MNTLIRHNLTNSRDDLIVGTIAKFSDGVWRTNDGAELPRRLLVVGFSTANVRWADGRRADINRDEPLPDVEGLNAKVPRAEWRVGPDGEPRPPWERQHVIYLLDPDEGGRYTYASSSIGARIAISDLRDRVETKAAIHGVQAIPLVELSSRPFKTKYGMKTRPHFTTHEWLTAPGAVATAPPLMRLPSPSLAEALDDSCLFSSD